MATATARAKAAKKDPKPKAVPLTISEHLAAVRSSAEAIRNDEDQTLGSPSLGDVVRQGDVYLVAMTALRPRLQKVGSAGPAKRELTPEGSQTGAHTIAGPAKLWSAADKAAVIRLINEAVPGTAEELQPDRDQALIGAIVETAPASEGECRLAHQIHADVILPADECFVTVFQRDPHAEEVRRRQD